MELKNIIAGTDVVAEEKNAVDSRKSGDGSPVEFDERDGKSKARKEGNLQLMI